MSKGGSLLLRVVGISMVVCRRHLSSYSCPKSKHAYTQAQLMSCLVLRAYLKQTYRGIVELLAVADGLRAALGLEDGRVPHASTLKKFADRVASPELLDGIVGQVLAWCRESGGVAVDEVAVDSTGLDPTSASTHFSLRSGRGRRHRDRGGRQYVKLSLSSRWP